MTTDDKTQTQTQTAETKLQTRLGHNKLYTIILPESNVQLFSKGSNSQEQPSQRNGPNSNSSGITWVDSLIKCLSLSLSLASSAPQGLSLW